MMICYSNRSVIILIVLILSSITQPICALAVDVAPRISDREIVEGLAEVRGDIKKLEQRFDAMDKRFDSLERQMNQRFETVDKKFDAFERQMNQRFDDMKWFLGVMIGTLLVINTGVLGYVLKRQGSMEKSLETIKDEMTFLKGVIEKLLPPKGAL